MKLFDACYFKQFQEGDYYEDGDGFVVANTMEEALGLCLEAHPETKAEYWWFEEIRLDQVNVSVCMRNINQ